jgi:hypothetical protein
MRMLSVSSDRLIIQQEWGSSWVPMAPRNALTPFMRAWPDLFRGYCLQHYQGQSGKHLRSAGRPARSRECKSLTMKEWRSTSGPSHAQLPARVSAKRWDINPVKVRAKWAVMPSGPSEKDRPFGTLRSNLAALAKMALKASRVAMRATAFVACSSCRRGSSYDQCPRCRGRTP